MKILSTSDSSIDVNSIVDSFKLWEILEDIGRYNLKQNISITKFAGDIGKASSNPYFILIFDFLRNNKLIMTMQDGGSVKIIKIYNKQIIDLALSSYYAKRVINLIHYKDPFSIT